MGHSTSCYIRLFPRQALVPLCPHLGAPSLPGPLLPPYLESCAEMLLCRHLLSPGTAPEMLVQPPRQAHHTVYHPGHRSLHFCFLPCPPTSSSHGSPVLSPPPTGTHPVLTSSSGMMTALRKPAVRARGSSAKQRCLGRGDPGQTGGVSRVEQEHRGLRALRFNSGVDGRPAGTVSLLSPQHRMCEL